MLENDKISIALDAILQKVTDHTDMVQEIVEKTKSQREVEKRLIELVTGSVEMACEDKMRTLEYIQKNKACQRIYVFVGSHWMPIPIQQYYDFCSDAAAKIGIPQIKSFDYEFMCKVFEQVAFSLARYQKTVIPEGEVWINLNNGTLELSPTPFPSQRRGEVTTDNEKGSTGVDTDRHTEVTHDNNSGCGHTEVTHDNNFGFWHTEVTSPLLWEGLGVGLTFREHRAEDFFTYCLRYDYDPGAECPRFHSFLDEVLPEKEAQELLMEYVGYCFSDNLKLEKTAVFYGTGSNGKSVILDLLTKLFGGENVSHIGLSELTTDPEKRSLMEGKLANISHESGKNLDTAVLKKVISGEPVDVRILYRGTHMMEKYGKLFTSFNILPPSEHTYGYFRRWLLFPFNITIPDDRQDVHLTEKLCLELSGIMNWVLSALERLVSSKTFTQSTLCNEALNEYKRTSNSALLFLSERCTLDDDGRTKLKDLYQSYNTYCYEEGVMKKFGKGQFRKILESWGATTSSYQGFILYNVKIKSPL